MLYLREEVVSESEERWMREAKVFERQEEDTVVG